MQPGPHLHTVPFCQEFSSDCQLVSHFRHFLVYKKCFWQHPVLFKPDVNQVFSLCYHRPTVGGGEINVSCGRLGKVWSASFRCLFQGEVIELTASVWLYWLLSLTPAVDSRYDDEHAGENPPFSLSLSIYISQHEIMAYVYCVYKAQSNCFKLSLSCKDCFIIQDRHLN